ncbi:MAG TPA: hypothetical protein VM864_12560 [Pyrinomonadaceae bacterium]|jgi:hypothetical protein|nr:hypothetical protein [Pyrinomonadaceae bacterium]
MDSAGKQTTYEVSIDCPVCCSGNRFELGRGGRALACDDCGFVLAEEPATGRVEAGECVFCGGRYFHSESPLSLPFLRRDSVCYVCEARYRGARVEQAGGKFKQECYDLARTSEASARWEARARQYDQPRR